MLKQCILLLLVISSSSMAWARAGVGGRPRSAAEIQASKVAAFDRKFSAAEKKFFYAIAGKAVRTIDINAKNAQDQYNCIIAYLNSPASCPTGRDMLEIVKKRYSEYRQAYALGHMQQFNQHRSLPGAPPSIIISTPYSSKRLDFAHNEGEWMNGQRARDKARIQALTKRCDLTEEDIDAFYYSRVTQIITSTPVVLMVNVISDDFFAMFRGRKYLPKDQDIVDGYKSYIDALATTRESFTTGLKIDNLEGLFMYQMLAAQVIEDDSKHWLPIFTTLNKKLTPQTRLESFAHWATNTIFSLNTLFIGCAVGATAAGTISLGTGFGVVAAVCTTAAAGLAFNTLLTDMSAYYDLQREWMSGIQDRSSVEAMRVRLQVDMILLAFNLYAMKAVTPASVGLVPATTTTEQFLATATGQYTRGAIERSVKEFATETGVDAVRGEFVAIGLGLAYREMLATKNLDRVAQVSADILFQYQQTGTYTFSTQADILCTLKAGASTSPAQVAVSH